MSKQRRLVAYLDGLPPYEDLRQAHASALPVPPLLAGQELWQARKKNPLHKEWFR